MIDVPAGHLFLGEHLDPAERQRNGEPVLLEAADLTTHGVIVGMTGSSKTGLGVVLVEEALLAGIPMLIVDPKGAGSLLGAMLGGRRGARTMARDMSHVLTGEGRREEAAQRVRSAENQATDRQEALTKLAADLARDLAATDEEWTAKAAAVEPLDVPLERSDIRVTARSLVWVPVA